MPPPIARGAPRTVGFRAFEGALGTTHKFIAKAVVATRTPFEIDAALAVALSRRRHARA